MKNDTMVILAATAINMLMFFALAIPALDDDEEEEEAPEEPTPEFNTTEADIRILRRVTDADEYGAEICSRYHSCQP